MTETERKYFIALNKDRSGSADTLEKPSMRGVQNSVVEKYSDQAHFIYELLQNADDVGATFANFCLFPDRLVFTHNGTRHFFITDPSREDEDTENGTLGDLNAITSVANSNKQQSSIGKFGVGFKAVFQYTNTPHIYDPNVCFKIKRFIVPVELQNDFPGRKKDETVFVFPFDHRARSAEEAYEDIADKLRNLVYPVLFLNHLQNVSYEINGVIGSYGKNIPESRMFGDISIKKLNLEKEEDGNSTEEYLWLFSRKDENHRDYSVGFFMDRDGKLKPVNMPAFCFFPTKEVTNLHFIIHAPFLLTDSREGIKAGETYNKELIRSLAHLAADSLTCLKILGEEIGVRIIDDGILDIVPILYGVFSPLEDKSKISFQPFYFDMRNVIVNGLLPTETGYTSSRNAYWSDTVEINTLFSDEQLGQLLDNPETCWVFRSYGRNTTGHNTRRGLQMYIDGLTRGWIGENHLSNYMKSRFIAAQSEEWLHKFYEWIGSFGRRFQFFKTKPIFLTEDGNPAAAYDKKGEKTLFLPSVDGIECPTIKRSLMENEKTKDFIKNTVKLEKPSLRDYIYNTIIPLYQSNAAINTDPHFAIFFNYYCECKHEDAAGFINQIKDLKFLNYYNQEENRWYRDAASALYYPDEKLCEYFKSKPGVHFIALSDYEESVSGDKRRIVSLHSFLDELGIRHKVGFETRELSWGEALNLSHKWQRSSSKGTESWEETAPDGCKEILSAIIQNHDSQKSLLLWDVLISIVSELNNLSIMFSGIHHYFFHSNKIESYETELSKDIKNKKWIVNTAGEFCAPSEITSDKMAAVYDTSSEAAIRLMNYLGIGLSAGKNDDDEDDYLTAEQKADLALAQKIRNAGLDDEETFADFLEYKRRRDEQKNRSKGTQKPDSGRDESEWENADDDETPVNTVTTIVEEIRKRTQQRSRNVEMQEPQPEPEKQIEDVQEDDVDEYNPGIVDYEKQIERKKEQSSEEIESIAQMQDLQEIALSAERYSYLWFKTLLEMEILNSDPNSLTSREVNISFGKIEREAGTQKTLILKQPNKYIPQYMEDLSDIPLVLHMTDGTTKTVAIEVSSVKSYTLRVKLRKGADIEDVDLSAVRESTIKAARPVFLLEKLKEGFKNLEFEDDYSMKKNLPANLEFVFGPPGTGKTTYLANNVLIPLMKEKQDLRVLVLTPTNKAADVLTTKIMQRMGADTSYENWLVRYGITGSEEIEDSAVFHDKTFDIRRLRRNVTITTIVRFPYDYFMPGGDRLFLQNMNWDYIVFDEASMIPIVEMIYPLYKKTPIKFIIAGDPFQIEPVTTVDLWADENIYTLVNLKSFVNPETEPMQYKVISLNTQYRSIPEIGNVFSQFTYGGMLQHHRNSASRRDLHLDKVLNIEPLNIIKFPVSKYESIYKAKRLNGTTPYQIYSAIFTMEYVCFLAEKLAANNPGEIFHLGVVVPYKAQANLIDKLMISAKLPKEIDVQVGTIHGFQGDECDIVMAVLNPPPGISSSNRLFLNKQNILNVAISRARDYLFLIMPDDNTDKVFNLVKVKQIESLMKKNGACVEIASQMLEETMFGTATYIEDNSFATSHQTVNVYGEPEMKYEIRSEDTAVDVQVHR